MELGVFLFALMLTFGGGGLGYLLYDLHHAATADRRAVAAEPIGRHRPGEHTTGAWEVIARSAA